MPVSIVLYGSSYYICGPRGNNINGVRDQELRQMLRHGSNPNVHHVFVAIGEGGAHFVRYYDERTKEYGSYYSLAGYEGLASVIDSGETPAFVSLGSDGYYFMRTNEGTNYWLLPDGADESLESARNSSDPVVKVWLGMDGAYVGERQSGGLFWNLGGDYGSLENTLRYLSGGIRSLALNLQNSRSYYLLSERLQVVGNATGTGLTVDDFQDWIRRYVTM